MYSMIKRLYSVAVKRVGWAGEYGLPDSAAETPIRASRTASLATPAPPDRYSYTRQSAYWRDASSGTGAPPAPRTGAPPARLRPDRQPGYGQPRHRQQG